MKASAPPRQLEELFAFFHYVWSKEKGGEEIMTKLENQKALVYDEVTFKNEVCLFVLTEFLFVTVVVVVVGGSFKVRYTWCMED